MNKDNLQKHVDYCRSVLTGATPKPATFYAKEYYIDNGCVKLGCLLGWTAFSFPYCFDKFIGGKSSPWRWSRLGKDLFNITPGGDHWFFLFGNRWSNDLEQAILRAEYLIEHDTPPGNWDYELRL